MPRLAFAALLFLLSLGGCKDPSQEASLSFLNPDSSKSPQLSCEVVKTTARIRQGLMYRKALDQFRGMLFIFPDQKPRSFWMKNTYIELDMVFIAKDFKVVSVYPRAKPLTTEARKSEGPAKYVLEINAGMAEEWGITKGSKLVLPEPLKKF